jgi:hypothetical protein
MEIIMRVNNIAVNIEDIMPMDKVIANPLIEPLPK